MSSKWSRKKERQIKKIKKRITKERSGKDLERRKKKQEGERERKKSI